MGAVCVDAAPVRFVGMAEHAVSAEMLTASRYDQLDVLGLGSPTQAVHSSWQVREAIASCRGDRGDARSWRSLQGAIRERKLRHTELLPCHPRRFAQLPAVVRLIAPLGHALSATPLQVRMLASSATATQTEVSEAQSVMLMRNLMRVTFSNVVYTRGIFDSSQFKPMNARIACHEWLA